MPGSEVLMALYVGRSSATCRSFTSTRSPPRIDSSTEIPIAGRGPDGCRFSAKSPNLRAGPVPVAPNRQQQSDEGANASPQASASEDVEGKMGADIDPGHGHDDGEGEEDPPNARAEPQPGDGGQRERHCGVPGG